MYEFKLSQVIWASSAGTMIEWYDFYIFGSLATLMAIEFFPPGNPVIAFLQTLAVFATGFAVRPFGAVVFGRIGDLIGRKYAFMVTITIMGLSTFLIGALPTYAQIGFWAPLILVALRLLQGLALGGEYGGAAVYVAEHAPDDQRGYYTSFIQTTATVGFFISLLVVLGTRLTMGEPAFKSWGWRIPFLLSIILVAISIYIRWSLRETPLYRRLKEAGRSSRQPIRDSLVSGRNWRLILLALLGGTAGQAVVWYTGQFYAFYFLQTICKVPAITATVIVAIALVIGTPFFLVFGSWSDRIGRKKIMMWGNLIAAITYIPIYMAMKAYSNPVNIPMLTLLVVIQVLYVTMVYGPIAAYLVELFPARIRYTSLSVPYHLGNGWFGGFTPLIATSLVAATGNIYMGLVYPISVAIMTFVVGSLYLKETAHVRIWDEIEAPAAAAKA
ncbi:MAG TPA: MFS transporter, partial [Candidatus Sulfotelmatobacter sp.]|nr:MFS transporter [Candidatus Sulfotelmatobacter sp.]